MTASNTNEPGKKQSFLSGLVEALVIRPKRIDDSPKIKLDTPGADLANAFALRSVYRRPKQPKK